MSSSVSACSSLSSLSSSSCSQSVCSVSTSSSSSCSSCCSSSSFSCLSTSSSFSSCSSSSPSSSSSFSSSSSSSSSSSLSLMLPSFLSRLADPAIKTVFLCGCGGGFDFVHSMLLYPELIRLKKKVVIGSFSFGRPEKYSRCKEVFRVKNICAKLVNAKSNGSSHYCPESAMCAYLDEAFPDSSQCPHSIYAYYAREYSIPLLRQLYAYIFKEEGVDAVVMFDGGSDSLMMGDEEGLGDPVEDAVSFGTVACFKELKYKVLVAVGVGSDRFNRVSDAATLRAISELTALGAFQGCVSVERTSEGGKNYVQCLQTVYSKQTFRSVISSMIISSMEGMYGFDVPKDSGGRIQKGQAFIWPMMCQLWAFDIDKVASRSLVCSWIKDSDTYAEQMQAFNLKRMQLAKEKKIRAIENLPRHEEMVKEPHY
eukprot:TRINITY_DN277_c0_g1_i1.p1 TRINITY_DN277_c0_g1~~TRINITY_DN277_c0_g1_i1.p1  ORF type:complete len:425 (-),score=143.77 TRINITY_DN277_c0_g1_i1:155-1429(-)